MKATWNDTVIAESNRDELIYIEGNWYFPGDSVKAEFLRDSSTRTTCTWKGEASYYDIVVDGRTNKDSAWFYPKPKHESIEKVRKDYTDYIAFWRGVTVSD